MPIKKSGLNMWKKYEAKYNPTIVETRYENARDISLERAQQGMETVSSIRSLVNAILDEYGIGGGERATYLAFATAILKHLYRQKGKAIKKIADGLKDYYVTAYRLNEEVCQEIISALGITIQTHVDVYITGSLIKIGEGEVTIGRPFQMLMGNTVVAEGIYPVERKFDVFVGNTLVGEGEK